MSARAVIDSLEFARGGQQLQDTVAILELTRLADSLYDTGGELTFALGGGYDAERRPRLNLRVKGRLNLKCQRCLGSLYYALDVESSLLVLTGSTGAETAEVDVLDGIPADPQADVWALVEDEVMLALPIAPRHPEGQCSAAVPSMQDRRASPFAVLGTLKQDQDQT